MNQDYVFVSLKDDKVSVLRTTFRGKVMAETRGDWPYIAKGIQSNILVPFDPRCIVVGYRTDLVKPAMTAEGLFVHRAWIDLAQLMWPLAWSNLIEGKRTLDELCRYLNLDCNTSNADGEVRTIGSCFELLMRRYRTALVGENAMTDIGGETLESLRHYVGF